MLKYSFIGNHSNCSKDVMLSFMEKTDKPFKYTYGYEWKGPSTYRVPISREGAIAALQKGGLIDVDEYEDFILVNEFSDNDMW